MESAGLIKIHTEKANSECDVKATFTLQEQRLVSDLYVCVTRSSDSALIFLSYTSNSQKYH